MLAGAARRTIGVLAVAAVCTLMFRARAQEDTIAAEASAADDVAAVNRPLVHLEPLDSSVPVGSPRVIVSPIPALRVPEFASVRIENPSASEIWVYTRAGTLEGMACVPIVEWCPDVPSGDAAKFIARSTASRTKLPPRSACWTWRVVAADPIDAHCFVVVRDVGKWPCRFLVSDLARHPCVREIPAAATPTLRFVEWMHIGADDVAVMRLENPTDRTIRYEGSRGIGPFLVARRDDDSSPTFRNAMDDSFAIDRELGSRRAVEFTWSWDRWSDPHGVIRVGVLVDGAMLRSDPFETPPVFASLNKEEKTDLEPTIRCVGPVAGAQSDPLVGIVFRLSNPTGRPLPVQFVGDGRGTFGPLPEMETSPDTPTASSAHEERDSDEWGPLIEDENGIVESPADHVKWIDLPPARSLEFWWPSLESEKFRVGARVRSGQDDHETVIWSPWIDGAAIGGAK